MPKRKRSSNGRRRKDDALELGTDKLYFKIGEVAEIVGVEASTLRYWEQEFPMLRPQKSRSNQRIFRRRDVETLLKIKHLLYARRFTIAGARQELRSSRESVDTAAPAVGYRARQSLAAVRERVAALRAVLDEDERAGLELADPAEYVRRLGGSRGLLGREPGSGIAARPEREPR